MNPKNSRKDSQKKITIEIKKSSVLVILIVFSLLFAYSLGRAKESANKQTNTPEISPTPTIIPTPTPTQEKPMEPKVINQQPVNTPALTPEPEIKKVSYTTTQASFNGTFYCYENRVNELSRQERNIEVKELESSVCFSSQQILYDQCVNRCINEVQDFDCIGDCKKKTLDICLPKAEEVGKEREKLNTLIQEICP
jgi:hypothetical protein